MAPKEKKRTGILGLFRKKTASIPDLSEKRPIDSIPYEETISPPRLSHSESNFSKRTPAPPPPPPELEDNHDAPKKPPRETIKKSTAAPNPQKDRTESISSIDSSATTTVTLIRAEERGSEDRTRSNTLTEETTEMKPRSASRTSSTSSRVLETEVIHYSPHGSLRAASFSPDPVTDVPVIERKSNIILSDTNRLKSIPVTCYDGRPKTRAPPPPSYKGSPLPQKRPSVSKGPAPALPHLSHSISITDVREESLDISSISRGRGMQFEAIRRERVASPAGREIITSITSVGQEIRNNSMRGGFRDQVSSEHDVELNQRYADLKTKFERWLMIRDTDKHSPDAKKLQMELIHEHDSLMSLLHSAYPDTAMSATGKNGAMKKRPGIAPDTFTPRMQPGPSIRSPLTISAPTLAPKYASSLSPMTTASSPSTSRSDTPKLMGSSASVSPAVSVDSEEGLRFNKGISTQTNGYSNHSPNSINSISPPIANGHGPNKTIIPQKDNYKTIGYQQPRTKASVDENSNTLVNGMTRSIKDIQRDDKQAEEKRKAMIRIHEEVRDLRKREDELKADPAPEVKKDLVEGPKEVVRPKEMEVPKIERPVSPRMDRPILSKQITVDRLPVPQKPKEQGTPVYERPKAFLPSLSKAASLDIPNGYQYGKGREVIRNNAQTPQTSIVVKANVVSSSSRPTVEVKPQPTITVQQPIVNKPQITVEKPKPAPVIEEPKRVVPQTNGFTPSVSQQNNSSPQPLRNWTVNKPMNNTTIVQMNAAPPPPAPVTLPSPAKSSPPPELVPSTAPPRLPNGTSTVTKTSVFVKKSPPTAQKTPPPVLQKMEDKKPTVSNNIAQQVRQASRTPPSPTMVRLQPTQGTISRNGGTIRSLIPPDARSMHRQQSLPTRPQELSGFESLLAEVSSKRTLRKIDPPVEKMGISLGKVVDSPTSSQSYFLPQVSSSASLPTIGVLGSPPPPPPPPPMDLMATPLKISSSTSSLPNVRPATNGNSVQPPPPPPPFVSMEQLNTQKEKLKPTKPIVKPPRTAGDDIRDSLLEEIRESGGMNRLRKVDSPIKA